MRCVCARLLALAWAGAWGLPAAAQFVEQTVAQAALLPASAWPVAHSATMELYLEVFVNGVSMRKIVPVRHRADGHLALQEVELRGVGLLPGASALQADGWVDVSRLDGVQARYDEATQTLHLNAQNAAMVVRALDAAGSTTSAHTQAAAEPVALGAFINHSFTLNTAGAGLRGVRRYQSVAGLLQTNVYGRWGVLSSAHVVDGMRLVGGQAGRTDKRWRTVRLDTIWSWYDEDRLLTVTAGDLVGSSLAWTRAVRLGGIQVRRNFAIRPDLVTMPMLDGIAGSAEVPSTVELYIDNMRRFSQDVAPGPFAITNLPPLAGAGTARLVVRDVLGRETVSETPFYASSNLLAKGLLDFAVEAGMARRNVGMRSNDYDRHLLASATARYGFSNAITLEGTLQGGNPAGGRLGLAGAGAVFQLGALGVAGLSGAASHYRPARALPVSGLERGAQFALHLETGLRGMDFSARHQWTHGRFHDQVSSTLELPRAISPAQAAHARSQARPPRRMSQFSLGLAGYGFGQATEGANGSAPSVSLSYTPITHADGVRARLFGVNLGQRLPGGAWLSISALRDLDQRNSGSVFAMFSWFLDREAGAGLNASASVAKARGNRAHSTLELSQSETYAEGSVGWRVRSTQGLNHSVDTTSQLASASYRHRYGRIEAAVEHLRGRGVRSQMNGRMQIDGAVVMAGGGVFFSNRIDDAFAVVNVGEPGVQVLRENTRIGATDADGQLLLPGLRAFERNQIAIDPMSLPLDARIPVLQRDVRPRWRSGAVVDFDVTAHTRSALVTLTDAGGAHLPVGTTVRLNQQAETVVGYDGQVWFEHVAEHNRLSAVLADGSTCSASFSASPTRTERLVIPAAVCRSE